MTSAASTDPVVIVDGARTPMGSFQGALKDVAATALGAAAIEGALRRAGVAGADVDEVIMGRVRGGRVRAAVSGTGSRRANPSRRP